MLEEFERLKGQLSELAKILNAFESEAVQLRILDSVLGQESTLKTPESREGRRSVSKSQKRSSEA